MNTKKLSETYPEDAWLGLTLSFILGGQLTKKMEAEYLDHLERHLWEEYGDQLDNYS